MIASLVLAAFASTASVHHAVSTQNAAAQASFDRGLLLYYAYNGDAAYDAFAQALSLDPHLAMAAWGEAIAAGSDLNTGVTPERYARSQAAALRAVQLEPYASPHDRGYVDAVALRYGGSWSTYGTDNGRYVAAMQALIASYPADDDARVLYAEALMENDLRDVAARDEIDAVLARNPQDVMANHLCIHWYDFAQEHAPALPCAQRLGRLQFTPQEEHLAHMPAHTYTVLGRYAQALAVCERAWQLRVSPDSSAKYAQHDAYTGYSLAMMGGDLQSALLWAARIGAAYGGSDAWATYARFGDWERLTGSPPPREFYAVLASGLAAIHRGDLASARAALKTYGANDSDYRWILEGAIDDAAGDLDAGAAAYSRALAYQTREDVGEQLPLFPAGEYLGAMYLHHARYADAAAAYDETLKRFPNDPRALYGLAWAQRSLGETSAAAESMKAFASVWGAHAPPEIGSAKVSP